MKNRNDSSIGLKRLWVVVLLPISFIITALSATSAAFRDFYIKNVYPFLSGTVNYLFSQTRISIAEIILIAFAAICVIGFVGHFLGILLGRKKGRTIVTLFINIICSVSVIYFLFSVTCGVNYYREPFAETEGLDTSEATEDELAELMENLVERLNEADEAFDRNYSSFDDAAERSASYVAALSERYPSLSGEYGAPKAVSFFGMMSYFGITGFLFPFTYEANVNETIPKMLIPVTMCHELVHLRGFMREEEANYIAYLACIESDDPEFVYSGLLLAYSYTASAMYGQDSNRYFSIHAELNQRAADDLRKKSEYWQQYRGTIAEVSDTINDTYLKINAQSDGTKSYGKMVDLLIAEMRSEKEP